MAGPDDYTVESSCPHNGPRVVVNKIESGRDVRSNNSAVDVTERRSSQLLAASRIIGNKEAIQEPSQHPLAARTGGCRGTDRRFREIKSLEEDNFLRFAGFRVYKCPVFGARGNGYNVSEVKDRRDRSNELYEQVAALG